MVYYPQAQPDFYNCKYKIDGYKHTLQTLLDFDSKKKCLYISEHGLSTAGKIYGLWQSIKPWLGFENRCNYTKIQAEILKFLHYGAIKGFSQNSEIQMLYKKIYDKTQNKQLMFESSVVITLNQLGGKNLINTKIKDVRTHLTAFCLKHQQSLNPCFWSKLFSDRIKHYSYEFGSTYLQLASSLILKDQIPAKAFYFIYLASSCNHPLTDSFEKKLTDCFNTACQSQPSMDEVYKFYKAKTRLRLAQRAFLKSDYQATISQIISAENIQSKLKKDKHSSIQAFCLAKLNKGNEADSILSNLEPDLLDAKSRPRCMESYLLLGDQAFSEMDSLKTSLISAVTLGVESTKKKLCKIGLYYYQRALLFSDSSNKPIALR